MRFVILVCTSVLSISLFDFSKHPTFQHFISILALAICMVGFGMLFTLDENRRAKELLKAAKLFSRFTPSDEAATTHNYKRGQYVYILQDIDVSGFCKIGKTNNPAKRLYDFGVKLPFRVQLIHIIQTDNMALLESILHRRYIRKRIRGEWFALEQGDIDTIKELRKVSFKVMSERCKACIFGANTPISKERFEELRRNWAAHDAAQECHTATIAGAQIGCKGHYEAARHGAIPHPITGVMAELGITTDSGLTTADLMQIGERMGWIEFVSLDEDEQGKAPYPQAGQEYDTPETVEAKLTSASRLAARFRQISTGAQPGED